ncbi:pentatricopeptide repeat-containing protein At4g18975, chloroplastic isoform X3 [Andrographis paniculata]|uniref:pentatricopeptide repeat-containing protein At4g18975, chloroplastic isoform X3 n=1 Tax=Andrographis paniculata TaxID=175694 RepID=UPI0021E96862|nr:pentatricopeptide repeat-containing protein At4g18975, chloroplastic isoform X3 [Andrographis paniculata]
MDTVSCAPCFITQKQVFSVDLRKLHLSYKYNVWHQRTRCFQRRQGLQGTVLLSNHERSDHSLVVPNAGDKKTIRRSGKKEHHLWKKRDSACSGQKALNLVQTVAKWLLSKGQGGTMATYDALLLAFDMEKRIDEGETLWNMILHAHNRSISKRLFSRIISLYYHNNMPNKVIEVFADMEELGVKPDEDTVRKIARAFEVLGQEDKQKLFLMKYQSKWKYIHFKGERVRVRT